MKTWICHYLLETTDEMGIKNVLGVVKEGGIQTGWYIIKK